MLAFRRRSPRTESPARRPTIAVRRKLRIVATTAATKRAGACRALSLHWDQYSRGAAHAIAARAMKLPNCSGWVNGPIRDGSTERYCEWPVTESTAVHGLGRFRLIRAQTSA